MKGFSLVELLVVIAIVGVLSAIAVPAFKNYTNTVKVSKLVTLFDTYADIVEKYYDIHGVYPTPIQIEPLSNSSTYNAILAHGWANLNPTVAIEYGVAAISLDSYSTGPLKGSYRLLMQLDNTWNLPGVDTQFSSMIYFGRPSAGGVWVHACGTGTSFPLDFSYLPAMCRQIINVNTLSGFPPVIN